VTENLCKEQLGNKVQADWKMVIAYNAIKHSCNTNPTNPKQSTNS